MTDVTQGELVPAPARVNEHGSPCPPWCAIDHAKSHGTTLSGKPVLIGTHISAARGTLNAVAVKGGTPYDDETKVQLRAGALLVDVALDAAQNMASLLDEIAAGAVKPADCGNLAAWVRAACAAVTAAAAQ